MKAFAFTAALLASAEALAQQTARQPVGVRPNNHLGVLYFGFTVVVAMLVLWIVATRYRSRIS